MTYQGLKPTHGGYWLDGPAQRFTDEEIAASDAKEYARNADAMPAIKAAGFIRYPLFMQTVDGRQVEKEAWLHPGFEPSSSAGFFERHGMRFNIYIPSYERPGETLTTTMLDGFGATNWYLCIDPSQFEAYARAYPLERLIIRDITLREPEMLDAASSMKHSITMAGHAPLCNFTLALSRSLGESHFWFSDDDIKALGMKFRKDSAPPLEPDESYDDENYWVNQALGEQHGFHFDQFMNGIEELTLQVRNPGFVGLEKHGIAWRDTAKWRRGTKVFCYYLTSNETQVTHYGRQNNDLVASIELGRHGLVNLLFKGVGYDSAPTQKGEGGQAAMYRALGVGDKGRLAARAQPASVKITYRNSRVHHQANFNNSPRRVVGAFNPASAP